MEQSRMLTLPGEEKPHLILSGLAFPTRRQPFDDLDASDADEQSLGHLLGEMASEVGYPVAQCADLWLYSVQLYRRLLLQWPLHMIQLESRAAVRALADALRRAFAGHYRDSAVNRRRVLECCADAFPFIRPSFYDCGPSKAIRDIPFLKQGPWSFEETPFVLPPPWHNATYEELAQGTLLLRDPSNAWRLGFWRTAFRNADMLILHLVRDARESIQGLCDGWNYPFGFQTLTSNTNLSISGYTGTSMADAWKQRRLNFSIDRQLSRQLLQERRQMTLVEVCGHQWRVAHERILADSQELSLPRIPIHFSSLRHDPVSAYRKICAATSLVASPSGISYATSFNSRWVMATVPAHAASYERWMKSPYATAIRETADREEFATVAWQLGCLGTTTRGATHAFQRLDPARRLVCTVSVCASV
jgi:hypothetical protein